MKRLGSLRNPVRSGIVVAVVAAAAFSVSAPPFAWAQGKELSARAKANDRNNNGVIDPDEAGGPLKDNFAEMDCDKSNSLDGDEIRRFFSGEGCPKGAAPAAAQTSGKPEAPAAAKPAGKPGGGPPAKAVRVDKVIVEPQSQTYPVLGRLVARKSGDVAARINGALVAMKVDVGDRVTKGDVIAELADERLAAERDKYAATIRSRRAMVRTAEAELAKKVQELARMGELRKSSAFSRARYEDLERDVEARRATLAERQSQIAETEAELQRASIDVYNTRIRAPYDGIVSEKHFEVGAYVAVGARVVSLINDNDLEVEAEVPTDRIAGLHPGARVKLRLDDGTRHLATVRAVIPQENLRTRTRPVRFTPDFGRTAKPLAANQSVTVEVPVGEVREVVTVHKDAVVHRGSDLVVFVVRNGKAFPRKIAVGDAVGARYAVTDGLKGGEIVVTHGNETLPPGSAVRVVGDDPAPRRSLGQ